MSEKIIVPESLKPNAAVLKKAAEFLKAFEPHELKSGSNLVLYFDEKSKAYYFYCHLNGGSLAKNADLEASLDANEDDELYKLNRDVTEDEVAFKEMEEDASKGRSFEDIVMEAAQEKIIRPRS